MEVQMRRKYIAMLVPAVFVAAVLASADAYAYHKVSIGGTVSRARLLKDCNAVGGLCGNCKGTSGDYSCTNTGNPGGETIVQCNSGGECNGYIPRESHPSHTLGGILRPPSAGIRSTGNNAPPKHHHHPVKFSGYKPSSGVKTMGGNKNKPVTITHNEEHHSGGHK
jgi:hypothetical protein